MNLADVSGIQKPRALKAICDRAQKYITTMADLGKPVSSIALSAADYDNLVRVMSAGRDKTLPPIDGLSLKGVVVRRGAA